MIQCPCCQQVFWDLMCYQQRQYLMVKRDYGSNEKERVLFKEFYNTWWRDDQKMRDQYFRTVSKTNPEAWEEELDSNVLELHKFYSIKDLKVRQDIVFSVPADPIEEGEGLSFPVRFPDIHGTPYSNGSGDDEMIAFLRQLTEPKPKTEPFKHRDEPPIVVVSDSPSEDSESDDEDSMESVRGSESSTDSDTCDDICDSAK